MTEIEWLPDRARLEVTHSMHLDDAMVLLAALGYPDGVLNIEAQAQLMLYAEQHFKLDIAGNPIELEPIGAQVAGDYLWIYQEIGMTDYPHSLHVMNTIMHGLDPEQQNQVNLRVGDHVRNVRFDAQRTTGLFE